MRIIIAPDKFKGSMTAAEAADHLASGNRKILPRADLIKMPLSDGGEGLIESLTAGTEGVIKTTTVTGPLGQPVEARWGLLENGDKAVIEMATASGLTLIPEHERNPYLTTSYGTGELIKAALDQGCREIIIGIGGSATNDGGAGMAEALGVKFYNQAGGTLPRGGLALLGLKMIDRSGLDPRIKQVKIVVASDVDNMLTGPEGASFVYGPQKGATPRMVKKLDRALQQYARMIRRELRIKVELIPGSGAAGGLGAGLIAFLGASLQPGIELVLDTLNIDQHLKTCRLLVTGEGKLDGQSIHGKAPIGVARRARQYNIPVVALVGSISGDFTQYHNEGISALFALANGPLTLDESMVRGPELLEERIIELMRFWLAAEGKMI